MIDIENKVITEITDALEAEFLSNYPGLVVYDTEIEVAKSFPCVTAVMSNNSTVKDTRELNKHTENHAHNILTVNVYTNNAVGAKELAKDIFQTIDGVLQNLNFTRLMASPMPNIDRTVTRITGEYSATVSEPSIQIIDDVETLVYTVYRN